jgi:hypothetical protein
MNGAGGEEAKGEEEKAHGKVDFGFWFRHSSFVIRISGFSLLAGRELGHEAAVAVPDFVFAKGVDVAVTRLDVLSRNREQPLGLR